MQNLNTHFWKKYDRLQLSLSVPTPHYPAAFNLAPAASQASTSAAN
jgi:hypothetical protein